MVPGPEQVAAIVIGTAPVIIRIHLLTLVLQSHMRLTEIHIFSTDTGICKQELHISTQVYSTALLVTFCIMTVVKMVLQHY